MTSPGPMIVRVEPPTEPADPDYLPLELREHMGAVDDALTQMAGIARDWLVILSETRSYAEETLQVARTSQDVANRHDLQFSNLNTSVAQIAEQLQWCVNQIYIMMNTMQGVMSNMNGGMLGKLLMKGAGNGSSPDQER